MGVIDDRGTLFGRFNLIDAAAVLFVVVLVPLSYFAYRVFRVPAPTIASVTPATLAPGAPHRIRVSGEHFRPYLRAFVSKTGEPFSRSQPLPDTQEVNFLIETPAVVELSLPDVTSGQYDLYLFDGGQELARRINAFTIEADPEVPAPRPNVPHDDAVLDITVRFDVDRDIASLLKVGEKDLNQPEVGITVKTPAAFVSLRKLPAPESELKFRLADGGRLTVSADAARERFESVIRLGVVKDHGVWVYSGPQRIRAGERFAFATSAYVIYTGIVTHVSVASRSSAAEQGQGRPAEGHGRGSSAAK